MIYDNASVAWNYFTGWFFIDFMSSIPLEQVFPQMNTLAPGGLNRALKLLKLVKLFRLFRFDRIVDKLQEKYQITYSTMQIAKFAILLVFGAHWLGCFFFFIAVEFSDPGDCVSIA